jgi:Rtr1/RPAP2 family
MKNEAKIQSHLVSQQTVHVTMSIPINRQHAPAVSSPLARSATQSESPQNASNSSKSLNVASKRSATKRKNGKAVVRSADKSPGKQVTPPTAKQKLVRESAEKRHSAQNTSFKWQEALFSKKTVDKATMIEAARYIQPAGYEDVIEERNIEDWCGYPMCSNERQIMNSKYKISLSERKVFDQTELSTFCSTDCLQRSRFYAAQLSDIPVWSRDAGWPDVEVIEMHEDVR